MPEDAEDHVAAMFHGLVSDLQRGDVARFEEEQRKQGELRAALRRQVPGHGLSAGELLKKIDGDPEEAAKKVQADLDRIDRDAKAAAERARPRQDPTVGGHFPPPPDSE